LPQKVWCAVCEPPSNALLQIARRCMHQWSRCRHTQYAAIIGALLPVVLLVVWPVIHRGACIVECNRQLRRAYRSRQHRSILLPLPLSLRAASVRAVARSAVLLAPADHPFFPLLPSSPSNHAASLLSCLLWRVGCWRLLLWRGSTGSACYFPACYFPACYLPACRLPTCCLPACCLPAC
jgi:hypothetical protein